MELDYFKALEKVMETSCEFLINYINFIWNLPKRYFQFFLSYIILKQLINLFFLFQIVHISKKNKMTVLSDYQREHIIDALMAEEKIRILLALKYSVMFTTLLL